LFHELLRQAGHVYRREVTQEALQLGHLAGTMGASRKVPPDGTRLLAGQDAELVLPQLLRRRAAHPVQQGAQDNLHALKPLGPAAAVGAIPQMGCDGFIGLAVEEGQEPRIIGLRRQATGQGHLTLRYLNAQCARFQASRPRKLRNWASRLRRSSTTCRTRYTLWISRN